MIEQDPPPAPAVAPQDSDGPFPFAAALRSTQVAVVITDPRLDDNPIVFANEAFLTLTAYGLDEVVGRNCRFLQGPETDPAAVATIRARLGLGQPVSIDLVNLRKDGTAFWNALSISPIVGPAGTPIYFVGVQVDVTERTLQRIALEVAKAAEHERVSTLEKALHLRHVLAQEIDHRVKNNLQMISAMLTLQTLNIPDARVRQTLKSMLDRVDAITLVHKRLYELPESSQFDIADFIVELAGHVVGASGRKDIGLDYRLSAAVIGADQAAALSLMLNEGLTNALKHGFKPDQPGRLLISLTQADGRCVIAIEDDGVGLPAGEAMSTSFGTTLLKTLATQIGATLEWRRRTPGTVLVIAFPNG